MRYPQRALLLGGFLVAGCAGTTEILGPDGEQATKIECPGAAANLSTCFDEADEVCPAGYTLLDTYQGGPSGATQRFGRRIPNRILVRCKPS
jgi:hypothetical protein